MVPLVMREFIKNIIDDKIKNLHPDVENEIIEKIIYINIKSKVKIISYIRKELQLPKVGSDKKIYWEKRGWSENEIKEKRTIKKMPSSPMKIENWLLKINEKTNKLYTIEEAKYKVKSFRKLNKEYWMEKGYSEEDSLIKVKEYQKENSNKFVSKILNNPEKYTDRTETQLNYWIKKGFNREESILKLKKRQNTTSLESYIKKYGEEDGILKYNIRVQNLAYQSSRKYYIDNYGEVEGNKLYDIRLENRITKMSKASKESFYFLKDIYKYIRNNGVEKNNIYWGVGHSNERFINLDGHLFFYDFTIENLKIIIDYHGTKFHPNPSKIEDSQNWKCLYSNISYEEKLIMDNIKKEIAIKKGYEYISVFSDDNLETQKNNIINIIDKKLKNK